MRRADVFVLSIRPRMKAQRSSVPQRRRADPTVAVPARAELVPTSATVQALLAEVRRPPAERLELERHLASGGMGAIDVAIDRALDRRLAVKRLHAHLSTDEQPTRMFLREARLTGLLEHPHIVPIYDIGERPDGVLYFTMKLVEGRTLSDAIREWPSGALDVMTIYWALDVVLKVCDALSFAHSRGVIHCDVKPANVMVGDYGQVYLMDWGIARLVAADDLTANANANATADADHATDHAVIGTPSYMSPEQARGDRALLDARSDVFLVGALLYEVLTRRPPFSTAERSEAIALAAACSFPAPRRVRGCASVPEELERIVLRAMAAAPDDRYQTVADLREALLRFMRGGAEFPQIAVATGDVIVREGDASDAAYIVVDGACEIRKRVEGHGEEVVDTLGPGAVFGEMAILTSSPRTATVVATEPTTLLVVKSDVLEQEIHALKPWLAALLRSLATRFLDVGSKPRPTATSVLGPARLANQLLMHATTWGERDADGAITLPWSTVLAELEAQLGASPIGAFALPPVFPQISFDFAADTVTIRAPEELRDRLRAELAKD